MFAKDIIEMDRQTLLILNLKVAKNAYAYGMAEYGTLPRIANIMTI